MDIAPSGLKRNGDQYYGSHPIHGSGGNMNFWINPHKQIWRCFRCDSGGGPLHLLAVLEGIIQCHEAIPGGLTGKNFIKTLEAAVSLGLVTTAELEKTMSKKLLQKGKN